MPGRGVALRPVRKAADRNRSRRVCTHESTRQLLEASLPSEAGTRYGGRSATAGQSRATLQKIQTI